MSLFGISVLYCLIPLGLRVRLMLSRSIRVPLRLLFLLPIEVVGL